MLCLASVAFSVLAVGQQNKSRLLSIEHNGKCGYIDKTGSIIIIPQFDTCWHFSEGFAGVIIGGKLGFIDETGRFISEPQFNYDLVYFSEGFATVRSGDPRKGKEKRGFIDTTGQVTFLPSVTSIYDFSEGLAVFEKAGRRGYLDRNMKVVIEPKYKYAASFYDGLARVQDEKGSYYINKSGLKVIDRDGADFSEGLARIEIPRSRYFLEKYGFMDTQGRIVIEPKYDHAEWFHEGFVGVQIDDKWGFIDKTGNVVIAPQFEQVGDFSEGVAAAKLDNKWGYIDRTGKVVIPFKFDESESFDDGIGSVKVGEAWGYIDKSGRYIWPPAG